MQEFAPAKINLYLQLQGRRPDGYHLVDSLVVFTDIGDCLKAEPADGLSLAAAGPFAGNLNASDNSVLQAARRLQAAARTSKGAHILLDKQLPVASGVGGGSSDAAAALRLLKRLWNVSLSEQDLLETARSMGADMSACLKATTLHMSGIGEIIKPAPALPPFHLVLVNPRQALATSLVFSRYAGGFSGAPRLPEAFGFMSSFVSFLRGTRNDLEAPAIACLPEIADILARLREQEHCLLARMSGSGATCFGVFETRSLAEAAASKLQALQPGWWTAAASIV